MSRNKTKELTLGAKDMHYSTFSVKIGVFLIFGI